MPEKCLDLPAMGSSASPGPTTGKGKRGTACPWKCSTQNIHGKRQHFSPPGELAWKGKEGGKRKREAPAAGVGIRAHGALSCSTLHPGWEYSGADPGLILTLSSSSQPRNNIPPKLLSWPHRLPAKPRATGACSSSLVKSR